MNLLQFKKVKTEMRFVVGKTSTKPICRERLLAAGKADVSYKT
jgi:hypothetical protein